MGLNAITLFRCGVLCTFIVSSTTSLAQHPETNLYQQTVQKAVAAAEPAIVRIETVGGFDVVGELLTGTGPTTGVVIREDGHIITSQFNFVAKPSSILVTLPDGQKFAATIVANDDSRKLTLLKIEAEGLKTLVPVPPDEMQVGQTAIALGRTFDPAFPNVAVGIVSALNRVWGRALQTDAHTSPANYGGALIDLSGRCLGIIVPLAPDQQGETAGVEWYDSGIGFAVPLADVEAVLDQLISGKDLKPGLMGASFVDKGPLSGEAKIVRVRPDSPVDKSGIQRDDIIVAIDDHPVEKLTDLKTILGKKYAGEEITLALKRGDERLEKQVTLTGELKIYRFPYLGVLVDDPGTEGETPPGVRVRHVFKESPAEEAGLRVGDFIEAAGQAEVRSEEELREQFRRNEIGKKVDLSIRRGMEMEAIKVTAGQFPEELPDQIAAMDIEPPVDVPEADTGRINEQLPGNGLEFWGYIPENYGPDREWGLMVWLHPAGDTMEAQTLRQWSELCQQRGLILVGPRAGSRDGWTVDQAGSIEAIIQWMQQRYSIDSQRIAVIGYEDSAKLAVNLAFTHRDLVRGLVIHSSPLTEPPPENDPDYPLQVVMVAEEAGATISGRDPTEASIKFLREAGFPTAQISLPKDADTDGLTPETVRMLALWLETLDRI